MKIFYFLTATLFAAFTVITTPSFAGQDKIGDLTIIKTWARATSKSAKSSAAYLVIENAGSTADKLIDVKSGKARKTQVHLSSMKDGMMKMEHVDSVEIPAGGKAMLKPGGYHVMFMGIKGPFVENTSFPLTLVFEKAGEITVTVPIIKGQGEGMNMGMKKKMPTN